MPRPSSRAAASRPMSELLNSWGEKPEYQVFKSIALGIANGHHLAQFPEGPEFFQLITQHAGDVATGARAPEEACQGMQGGRDGLVRARRLYLTSGATLEPLNLATGSMARKTAMARSRRSATAAAAVPSAADRWWPWLMVAPGGAVPARRGHRADDLPGIDRALSPEPVPGQSGSVRRLGQFLLPVPLEPVPHRDRPDARPSPPSRCRSRWCSASCLRPGSSGLRDLPGMGLVRTLLTTPILVAPVVAAVMWRFMYQPDFGVLNTGLTALGLPRVGWLSDPIIALLCDGADRHLAVDAVRVPDPRRECMRLPRNIYEAAELDGAGSLRQTLSSSPSRC